MKMASLILTPFLTAALLAGTAAVAQAQDVAPGRTAHPKPAVQKAQPGSNAAARLRNIAAKAQSDQHKAVRKHASKQIGAKIRRALSKAKTPGAKKRIIEAAKKAVRSQKQRTVVRPGAKVKHQPKAARAGQARIQTRGRRAAPAAKGKRHAPNAKGAPAGGAPARGRSGGKR